MIFSILFLLAAFVSTWFYMLIDFRPVQIFLVAVFGFSAVYGTEMFARNALAWPQLLGGLVAIVILVLVPMAYVLQNRTRKSA